MIPLCQLLHHLASACCIQRQRVHQIAEDKFAAHECKLGWRVCFFLHFAIPVLQHVCQGSKIVIFGVVRVREEQSETKVRHFGSDKESAEILFAEMMPRGIDVVC